VCIHYQLQQNVPKAGKLALTSTVTALA
jgi:hypothetical protein